MTKSVLRPRAGAVVAAVLAVAGTLLAPSATAEPTKAPAVAAPSAAEPVAGSLAAAEVPTIDWKRCGRGTPAELRCATVEVPLDYDEPDGARTTLALAKRLASGPASQRIGSLFVNPGGPGAPALDFVMAAAQRLGPVARQRFDVVGIDPRGVGASTPARCRLTGPVPFLRVAFPYNKAEAARQLRFNRVLRAGCAEHGNAILDHMSTADTARDMDLIRQALGDEQLTYYGISYGTYLGATYAAMFPDQVRALIVDGVLDPVAWSTGSGDEATRLPFSTRLGSGLGAAETLDAALTECNRVGAKRCALAPRAHAKWNQIDQRLRQSPARVYDAPFRFSDLYGSVLGPMYARGAYRQLMRQLDEIHGAMFGRGASSAAVHDAVEGLSDLDERVRSRLPAGPYVGAARTSRTAAVYPPWFEGVACSDSINPTDPRAWATAATFDDRRGGSGFGRLWTWASSACAGWPGSDEDAFRGPWELDTSTPVLIVGNTHDPSTPITGARALHELFGNSRLVTLETWGHGALGASRCVTGIYGRYLATQTLPAADRTCQPNKELFPTRP